MKQNFYSLLLAAAFSLLGTNAWADDYEIATAQDLADFATAVTGGKTDANAVLTADIDMSSLTEWTPIGDWNTGAVTSAYSGHFDGQGHTISGFNFTASQNYFGIFGVITTGALIENFTVEGSITIDGNIGYAAGVVAYARDKTPTIRNVHSKVNISSTSTASTPRLGGVVGGCPGQNSKVVIDRCTYSGTLNANDKGGNYGGIIGYILNNTNVSADITNCLFDGKLQGTVNTNSAQYGGIIGYTRKGIVSVSNCLSLGTFEYEEGNAMNIGQFIGRLTFDSGTSGCTFDNNYYVDNGYELYGTFSGGAAKGAAPVEVTAEQLASGEICFLLNERVSGGENWFQTLVDDAHPFPYNSGVHDPIYANGSFKCDMTPKEGSDVIYSNVNSSFIDDHTFADGFCTVCNAIDETWLTPNSDGFFEIANEKQLLWFATYVNEVNAAPNAVLTADINLTKAWTTPIGNASVAYTGKFDGQGKSITGFDQTATTTHNGLFGNINGATVQNFSISGSLTSDKNYCGVIGLSKGSSKVKGIHSSLDLDIQFKGWAGGVVGGADGSIVIEECSFDGTLDTHNFDDSKGGILGYANGATIKNCLFSGTIKGEAKQHYGGILGYVNNGSFGGVQNCLSMGSVTTTNTSHNGVAAIIGNMNTSTKVDGVFNNYWLAGSSYAGNNGAKAADAEAPIEVTAEQLASGEVAYKLGAAWSQLLGTESSPVPTGINPVFYVGDAGYATLYDTTTGYTLGGNVKAYVAILNSTWLDLSEIENVPAGTPVILKGSYYNKLAADLPAINIANDLKGTDTDTAADGTMYILANGTDGIGFYLATGTIPAGKAYFQSTSGVKSFRFDADDATGINGLNGSMDDAQPVYNLAGQRMSKKQKGINIVGKKKVLY